MNKFSNLISKTFNIECSTGLILLAKRYEENGSLENENTSLVINFYLPLDEKHQDDNDNFCKYLCLLSKCIVLNIILTPPPLSKFYNAKIEVMDTLEWVWQACLYWKINRKKIYLYADGISAIPMLSSILDMRNNNPNINIAGMILTNPILDFREITTQKSTIDNQDKMKILKDFLINFTDEKTQIFDNSLSLLSRYDWTRMTNILLITSKNSISWQNSLSLYHKIINSEGNIIFYQIEADDFNLEYKKKYKEKKSVEKLIQTFISNNDPDYIKLLFKDETP